MTAERGETGTSGDTLARLRIGCGVRAVEADLLDTLEADLAELRGPPLCLDPPLRLVVPSRSLREHVTSALLARCGRAVVGLRIQTLAGLAREIVDRAGELAAPVEGLLGVLAARAARREPSLAAPLGGLRSGFGWVAASVADLLDAGLEPAHAEALEELLGEGGEPDERERARAVVRVACATAGEFAALGAVREGDLLARATLQLERAGVAALPARALRVHGFADVTGRVAELLLALLRRYPSLVWLDVPRDPWRADSASAPRLEAYTARLRERVEGVAHAERVTHEDTPPALRLRCAPRPEDEVRAVARELRELIDAGVAPEAIGVVARELAPFALSLRAQFGRLGVPFSGVGQRGPAAAPGRRLAGLLELLRDSQGAALVRWLELVGTLPELGAPPRSERADLALAGHVLGASRLGEFAALELPPAAGAPALALPVRRGLAAADGAGAAQPAAAARRRAVSASRLAALQRRVRHWLREQQRWAAQRDTAAGHVRALAALARRGLGWSAADPAWQALRAALDALGAQLPRALVLEAEELRPLLARALAEALAEPLGGAGGGVQVLGVMEARARSFEHLFVLGLTRDAFPRRLPDDPLLPDALRARLAWLLPDLPIRARAHDEERHLFAQLLSASPRVCLSRAERDAQGSLALASGFLERFALAGVTHVSERASALAALDPAAGPRTAYEHARLAALHGGAEALRGRLELALAEADPAAAAGESRLLAQARIALLEELERGEGELGPYGGWVGAVRSPGDPRAAPLYVTALEALARCPWQAFLRRVLRIEPPLDAAADLPGLDPRRIGETLHRACERIAAELGVPRGVALGELEPGKGRPLAWPREAALQELLAESADEVLRAQGVRLPGLARALAHSLWPRLRAALRLLGAAAEGEPALQLLGAEVEGELGAGAAGLTAPLRFRADWVLERAGRRLLVDFKTGRPFATGERNRTAQRAAALASGLHLQAMVYGWAAGGEATGLYAYLDPELPREVAWCELPSADPGLRAALESVLPVLEGAYYGGVFPPRLLRRGSEAEPAACRFCEVSEACAQGDLAARRRFAAAAERGEGDGSPLLAALLALPEPPA